jgi:UDP-N-acetyl-D-mannosaminuronic acid dehydrogenase
LSTHLRTDQQICPSRVGSIDSSKKILVIGLGEIGLATASYLSSLGVGVDGYDIRQQALENAKSNQAIHQAAQDLSDYDYYIICVSTHSNGDLFVPDLGSIYEIAEELARKGKPGSLVCIDSTVTVGTTRRFLNIVKHKLHVAHIPHRYYANERDIYGVRQIRVAGGCEPCCLKSAMEFYNDGLGIPLVSVEPVEIAEASKLVENASRFLQIAFTEEIKLLCDKMQIDFNLLRSAVNSKWNVKLLEARKGINGHCLPKDSHMYSDLVTKHLGMDSIIKIAKKIDRSYRDNLPS